MRSPFRAWTRPRSARSPPCIWRRNRHAPPPNPPSRGRKPSGRAGAWGEGSGVVVAAVGVAIDLPGAILEDQAVIVPIARLPSLAVSVSGRPGFPGGGDSGVAPHGDRAPLHRNQL